MAKPSIHYDDIEILLLDDPDPDASYLEQEGFEDRLRAYERGDFGFMGVVAEVEVDVEGTIQTIRSAGIWGVESDSDDDHVQELAEEEREDLLSQLNALNVTVRGKPRKKRRR